MKKNLLSMLAMATMLFATGCSDEENIMESNKQNVTFTIALEDAGTGSRAIAEGVTIGTGYYVDELHYAVYEVNKSDLLMEGSAERKTDGTFSVTIPLVNQLDFEIAFFAHDKDASAFEVPTNGDLRNLEFKTSLLANQETYDAFSTVITHRANAQTTNKVELKRILAQLNVAGESDDIANATKLGANATHSKIKLTGVYTKFDARTGIASTPDEVVYDVAPILKKYDATTEPKNELLTVGTDNYYYLAMAYALVNTESDLFNSELTFYRAHESNAEVAGNAVSVRTIPNLPLQRNYRTNVTGSILTQDENFSITLDTDFGVEDHNVESDDIALVKDLDITEVAQLNNALKELLKVEKEVILNVKGLKNYTYSDENDNIVIPAATNENPVKATKITLNLLDVNMYYKVVGAEFAKTVVVATDLNTTINNAEIIIPNAHVKVIGNYTSLTISSSSTTLEVAEGSSIGTLTVMNGNVAILNGGAVDNIVKHYSNQETTIVTVEPGGVLTNEPTGTGINVDTTPTTEDGVWVLSEDVEVTRPINIPAGEELTIDLNGYTITTIYDDETKKHLYAFDNKGTLTIKDSKGNGKIIARGINNYGKLTLEGGTIDACDHNGGYAVVNYVGAEFVMNGGAVVTSNENGDEPGSGYDATPIRIEESAKATINGGTITNVSNYTFALDNHGEVTINGGTYSSIHTTVGNYGTLTINGGSFTCDGLEGITAHALWASSGTTTINGGTFDGKDNYNGFNVDASEGATVYIKGGKFLKVHSGSLYGNGTIVVTGGNFFDEVAENRLANGYYAVKQNDNTYTIVADNSLQADIDNATNGATITLDANVALPESLVIPEGKTLTLDLNNYTIEGPSVARDAEDNRIHVIVNNGTLTIKNGTVKSVGANGGSALYNNAGATLTINNVNVYGAPFDDSKKWPSYGINNYGTLTINGADIKTYHGAIATGGDGVATINDATVDVGQNTQTKQTSWALYVFENGQLTVNGGTFKNTKDEQGKVYGGGYICATSNKETIINGGTFDKTEGDNNGTGLYYNCENLVIKGGTFDTDPSKYVAKDYLAIMNDDNIYEVKSSIVTVEDGGTLNLSGINYADKIKVIALGDLTIVEDIAIKTLQATNGGIITIKDGKTLTLNNFSFGSKDTAGAEYEIKGGTIKANYGFFQHGKYALYSNFETGYMYYSYGSDITVYGTFHSQGKGDGLDYVRGKLTIANGGKSIHDKSLWVGQPASWGAMSASLTIEEGGYVEANSLSVYEGSSLTYYNDTDLKYNSVSGTEFITKSSTEQE